MFYRAMPPIRSVCNLSAVATIDRAADELYGRWKRIGPVNNVSSRVNEGDLARGETRRSSSSLPHFIIFKEI